MTADLGNNRLPVVHPLSPCSPLHGRPSSLTLADVLRRDTYLVKPRGASPLTSDVVLPDAPAPAPAGSSSGDATIPIKGSSDPVTPAGALDYSVVVGYGTPAQQFPVFLDTSLGMSLLRCKPCKSSSDCDPAFDTSRSSTFTHVPCGSPDCPTTNCSPGSSCPLVTNNPHVGGTFARDVLTLTPSTTVHAFRLACFDVDRPSELPEAGILDLSRDRNSLPSRLSQRPCATAGFSYCLPQSPSSHYGFLSPGGGDAVRDDNHTTHAPMVNNPNPRLVSMYFIDVVGMSLGGVDLPIPAGTFDGNGTNLDLSTTFTLLKPEAYAPLRDAFRWYMSRWSYPVAPALADFDTCYNFTGLHEIVIPLVGLKFGNGESLVIHAEQMLYFEDLAAAPFTVACLAFSTMGSGQLFSVVGTYTLASTEVVYDLAGGKVGFNPRSC